MIGCIFDAPAAAATVTTEETLVMLPVAGAGVAGFPAKEHQIASGKRQAELLQSSKRQAATNLPTCDELTVLKPAKSVVSFTLSLVERPPLVVGMKFPIIKRSTGRRRSRIWSNRVGLRGKTGH